MRYTILTTVLLVSGCSYFDDYCERKNVGGRDCVVCANGNSVSCDWRPSADEARAEILRDRIERAQFTPFAKVGEAQ